MTLHDFDSIRPFEPNELPEVFDRMLQNEQFLQVLAYLYPGVPKEAIGMKMHQCKTNLDFQKTFCYDFLKKLLAKASLGIDNDNIWIAQREGRAKNSDDRTQEAILKMMTMGGEGSVAKRLLQLHIVPLAISYEYDPCDFLKAREMQLRRDVEGWKKGPMDDVVSMQTGIMGYKGHIYYHCAPCIDEWLNTLPEDMPKGDFYKTVATHIDHEIWRGYRLYPGNYVALDLLHGTSEYTDKYTDADRATFEKYIDGQLAKIQDLPNPDMAFLRERILEMYANPAINQLSVAK